MTPVILSGGGGSRLWPVSRQSFPKQFCELLDESLFNKTAERLKPFGSPWVITIREMKALTERSLIELGLPTDQMILEPFGKNTAAAVALVCKKFELLGRANEIVGIFPADHLIDDEQKFVEAVFAGEKLADAGHVVTLGVQPSYPATGYGYIETSGALN
ncbi:MAG: mannose-1-phosphate guanylyltransferase/mannose-6-phosphate isomerase, partial [Proteobacteria bacterium]